MKHSQRNKKPIFIFSIILGILIIALSIFFITNNKTSDKEPEVTSNSNVEENDIPKESETTPKVENRFEGLPLTSEDIGIPVLYYHSVLPDSEVKQKNEVTISPEKLKEELQLVKSLGYTTLTMSEVNDYILNNKEIPQKSILITFDDGYTDNYAHAFPILKELNMKATVFVISSGIDSGYYMSTAQLKEMSDYGIDIESHTVNHVHLNTLTYEQQLKELKDSKAKIESVTNKPVLSIAYPFGDFNENSKKASIDAGYSLAFTTNLGLANKTDNRVALDRIYVNSEYSLDTFKSRLINTKK
ncbi:MULTISPECIES: polysaccharide deacetylase family protein [Clostridium]|uniref:Polysaccharide deacetylase family protein n=1 Tax=Clostridium cibarium TaxID=2762247 RepID=A0ABR8PUT4_9CLOT|nr:MULTISPECIES: polysaccharide deacetylase family protein [Clostridium]MBD7911924.1 polysaccharide deacetylase family protein [Clostridium cibarium]